MNAELPNKVKIYDRVSSGVHTKTRKENYTAGGYYDSN